MYVIVNKKNKAVFAGYTHNLATGVRQPRMLYYNRADTPGYLYSLQINIILSKSLVHKTLKELHLDCEIISPEAFIEILRQHNKSFA